MIYQKSHKYANIAKSIIIYGITVLFMALASLIFYDSESKTTARIIIIVSLFIGLFIGAIIASMLERQINKYFFKRVKKTLS